LPPVSFCRTIAGVEREDYFSSDFTVEELKKLGIRQRKANRDVSYDYKYSVVTLEEYIQVSGS
jgi:hypothetical protein